MLFPVLLLIDSLKSEHASLLNQFRDRLGKRLHLMQPERRQERLSRFVALWEYHDAVAISLQHPWCRRSLGHTILQMEKDATVRNKHLIIATRGLMDFVHLDIVLAHDPFIIQMDADGRRTFRTLKGDIRSAPILVIPSMKPFKPPANTASTSPHDDPTHTLDFPHIAMLN